MRLSWLAALVPLAACGPDTQSGACKDNLVAGDLVITEVMADFAPPAGGTGTDDGKEWIEIYNNAERPISLKGVTLIHSKADGSSPSPHEIDDITLAPGQFFTMGNATQDLVPAYVDYGYGADLGDLSNSTGGQLALKCGSSTIDQTTYENVKSGHSRELSNAAAPDYSLNDDPANWCEANDTEFDVNNFGTPGQDNDCAPVIMGACNDSGSMRPVVSPAPGQLVITEFMASPDGTDGDTEWFEARALGSFDLNGLAVGRISDTTPEIISPTDCIPVTAGTDIIFAHTQDMMKNGSLPAGKVLATFATGLSGSSSSGGDIQITLSGTVIDAVSWPSATTSKSSQLDPDALSATANDDISNFCVSTTVYPDTSGLNLMNYGSPGAPNAQCGMVAGPGMCMGTSGLRAIVKPQPDALVINEYLANPAGTVSGVDAAQEWFEITNAGTQAFDLNDLTVQGSGATTSRIVASDCKSVPVDGFALLAHNTDSTKNGGLPTVDATFPTSISLGQTSGKIQILDGTTPLDVIAWTAAAGAPDGIAIQLDPSKRNATANDAPPVNYCQATAAYGTGNKGTPKAANATCP